MTGTEDFSLSGKKIRALREYLTRGGTLIADAAGSSRAFAEAFRREILSPIGPARRLPQDSAFYRAGPYSIDTIHYRRATAVGWEKDEKPAPRIEAVYLDGRAAVLFSPDELTAGLLGYPLYGLKGLRPDSARKFLTDVFVQCATKAP